MKLCWYHDIIQENNYPLHEDEYFKASCSFSVSIQEPSYESSPIPRVSSTSFPYLCNDDKLWQSYSDEASDVTPFTFNKTIGMSNIDFNESPTQASSLTSNIVEEKQSSQELNGAPSSEPRRHPVNNPSTNIDIDSNESLTHASSLDFNIVEEK